MDSARMATFVASSRKRNWAMDWRLPSPDMRHCRRTWSSSSDTAFAVGAWKLSGTMAALIGSAAYFNVKLEQQTSVDLDRLFDPHIQTWYAMDLQRSVPIKVSIAGMSDAINLPDTNALGKASLDLEQINGEYTVLAEEAKEYRLGELTAGDLTKAGLFNTFSIPSARFVVTERLTADSSGIDLNPLPLTFTTGAYGGEYSRYTLQTADGTPGFPGAIRGRGIELATVDGHTYLVAVVELNHLGIGDSIPPYAKFAIAEIETRLEP